MVLNDAAAYAMQWEVTNGWANICISDAFIKLEALSDVC